MNIFRKVLPVYCFMLSLGFGQSADLFASENFSTSEDRLQGDFEARKRKTYIKFGAGYSAMSLSSKVNTDARFEINSPVIEMGIGRRINNAFRVEFNLAHKVRKNVANGLFKSSVRGASMRKLNGKGGDDYARSGTNDSKSPVSVKGLYKEGEKMKPLWAGSILNTDINKESFNCSLEVFIQNYFANKGDNVKNGVTSDHSLFKISNNNDVFFCQDGKKVEKLDLSNLSGPESLFAPNSHTKVKIDGKDQLWYSTFAEWLKKNGSMLKYDSEEGMNKVLQECQNQEFPKSVKDKEKQPFCEEVLFAKDAKLLGHQVGMNTEDCMNATFPNGVDQKSQKHFCERMENEGIISKPKAGGEKPKADQQDSSKNNDGNGKQQDQENDQGSSKQGNGVGASDALNPVSALNFETNVYYDFQNETRLTPFVFVGAGVSVISLHSTDANTSVNHVGYNAGLGVSYAINELWTVDLSYQYRDYDSYQTNYSLDYTQVLSGSRSKSHSVITSMRFAF